MSDSNTIAAKIKKYRKEKNMSQNELSTLSGINISTIKKYESGYRNPKPEQLLKISEALGVSINAFMEFEIKTISDVLSLLIRMDEQTNMNISGEKDENGEYIPDSITINFNDTKINDALSLYMKCRDYKNSMSVAGSKVSNNKDLDVDYILNDYDGLLENTKCRLMLDNGDVEK